MVIEVTKLIRDHIGIRQEVKGLFPELVLHLGDVERQFILSGNLLGVRKVVDFLKLVQTFVEIRLAGAT